MLFLKNVISEKEVPKGFHRGTTQSDSKRGQIVENHIPDFQHDVLYNMWSFRLFFTTINYESFRQQQMQAQVANLRSFKLNPFILSSSLAVKYIIYRFVSIKVWFVCDPDPKNSSSFQISQLSLSRKLLQSFQQFVRYWTGFWMCFSTVANWKYRKMANWEKGGKVFWASVCCLINQGGNINNYIYSTQMATYW